MCGARRGSLARFPHSLLQCFRQPCSAKSVHQTRRNVDDNDPFTSARADRSWSLRLVKCRCASCLGGDQMSGGIGAMSAGIAEPIVLAVVFLLLVLLAFGAWKLVKLVLMLLNG